MVPKVIEYPVLFKISARFIGLIFLFPQKCMLSGRNENRDSFIKILDKTLRLGIKGSLFRRNWDGVVIRDRYDLGTRGATWT